MKSFYKAYNVTFIKFLDGNLRKHLEKDPVVFIKHYQEARTVLGNATASTENLRNSSKHRKKKKKSKSKIEKNNGELKIIKSEPEREEKNQSKSSNSRSRKAHEINQYIMKTQLFKKIIIRFPYRLN